MARQRHVRLEVRRRDEVKSATSGVVKTTWSHQRWQHFTLRPMSSEEIFRVGRMEVDVDWIGASRSTPEHEIRTGWRLYAYTDSEIAYVLEVVSAVPLGRKIRLLLKERTGVQS